MSRATDLSQGLATSTTTMFHDGPDTRFMFSEAALEAFYHATRAEALREAAERLTLDDPEYQNACSNTLRAMADREGK